MKPMLLALALVCAVALFGCSTADTHFDLTGKWTWECCDGNYSGKMELMEFRDAAIKGRMYDTTGGAGGLISGSVRGNQLEFTRTWGAGMEQHYKLTIGPDGKSLTGSLDGNRNRSVPNDFKATRQ